MSDDIVKRLRYRTEWSDNSYEAEAFNDAADEIERLRAERDAERERRSETFEIAYYKERFRQAELRAEASQQERVGLHAERDALRAQLAEACEALEPFVEAAANFDTMPVKDPEGWFAYSGQSSFNKVVGAITVGDLRRARAVYEKIKGGGDE